jgi:tryptophanyl-tRNA synthetase
MSIKTDDTPLEEPKNPDTCNVFALYKLLASSEDILTMRNNYQRGNYGYGHAKQALFELMIIKFAEQRTRYNYYMENLNEIDKALAIGAKKASKVADEVLDRVRIKLGY